MVNPLGLVPALRTDSGAVLTENAAILQFIADRFPTPASRASGGARRLQQWLCFIGTELHKALFVPLFDKTAPQDLRHMRWPRPVAARLSRSPPDGPRFPARQFSVADAYLSPC